MEKYKLSDLFEKPISGEWGNELEEGKKGTRVLRTTNFTNIGRIDFSDVVERDVDLEKYSSKILKKGDIIIEKSGGSPTQPVGRVIYFDKEDEVYLCNNFTAILRPNERIYPKFALYLMMRLHQTKKVMKFQNKTTGIINLKLNDYIETTKVNIPSIETQKKIVEVLDKAQYLIDKKKEQIDLLDELVKSRFVEMFGNPIKNEKNWEIELLGEICDLKAGKNIKASEIHDEQTDGLYPCYGGNGLRGYVNKYSHEGNINLIGRQGALCGNVKYARGKFYATEHAVVTQPKIEINSYWLHFVLIELNLNRLSTGAAQPGLTVGKLNEVEVIIPPIELQNEFAEFVTKTDSIRSKMETSLSELEDNFNSLMQKAFKGELF